MPEMQPSMSSPAAMPMPLGMGAASSTEDFDYALGCECADPALQIERWGQEAVGASSEAS
jgi:hypothetical protein